MPARWLFQASQGMLAQKLITLASTILLLHWMKILTTQGICKEATRLHTYTIEGFWSCLKRWMPRSRLKTSHRISTSISGWEPKDQQMWSFLASSQQLNRCYERSSWYFPDVEGCDNKEEEDACIVSQTQTARTLLLKDLPILAHSAITTSSTRRR